MNEKSASAFVEAAEAKPRAHFIVSPEIIGILAVLFLLGAMVLAWGPG